MTRPFILGLTGSMAMGKSTVAAWLRARNIPVFDSDAAVHDLYRAGQPGALAVARLAPQAVTEAGVDRAQLSAWLQQPGDMGTARLQALEQAIHPLVASARASFLAKAEQAGQAIVVFDVPLLFEVGGADQCDAVLLVTAPYEVQHARALARPGMTEEKFAIIRARQMDETEKRSRADFVLDTSKPLAQTEAELEAILKQISS